KDARLRSGHPNRTRLSHLARRENVLEEPAHDRPARARGLVAMGRRRELLVAIEVARLDRLHRAALGPDLDPAVVMREGGRRRTRIRGAARELPIAVSRL